MFLFEGKGKSIDDRTKYLQQLCNPIESFGFVDKLEEDIVDRPSNKGSQIQKLAVYSMKSSFEKITFTGIL
jgi:hypothetical protein